MAGKAKSLVGNKYGLLEVLNQSQTINSNYGATWLCKCDCGKEILVGGALLKRGKKTHCGCNPQHPHNKVKNREEEIVRRLYSKITYSRNKKYNVVTDISFEEFYKLIKSTCHYCGCEPASYENDRCAGKVTSETQLKYNGLDRVDSLKGYLKDNVVTCCYRCNVMKSNLSYEKFMNHITKIYEHNYIQIV